jgi:hypothetical protein
VWNQQRKTIAASAKLWRTTANKVGDNITPRMRNLLDRATEAARASEQTKQGLTIPSKTHPRPYLTPESTERSAFLPRAIVRAEQGDPEAKDWLDLQDAAARAPETIPSRLTNRRDDLASRLDQQRKERIAQIERKFAQAQQGKARAPKAAIAETGGNPNWAYKSVKELKADLNGGSWYENDQTKQALQDYIDARQQGVARKRKPPAQPRVRNNQRTRRLEAERRRLGDQVPSNAELRRIDQRIENYPTRGMLAGQAQEALTEFRGSRGPLGLEDPLWVRHAPLDVAPPKGVGGGIGRTNEDPRRSLPQSYKHRSGHAFQMGALRTDPEVFFGDLARVGRTAEALNHLQAQVSRYAVPAEPGMTYDPARFTLIRTKARSPLEHPSTAHGATTAPIDQAIAEAEGGGQTLEQVLAGIEDEGVPTATVAYKHGRPGRETPTDAGDGDYLIPNEVLAHLKNDFKTGKAPGFLARHTQAWKWLTLLARPAWLANNVVGNTSSFALATGGITPDALRALNAARRNDTPLPPGVENTGFIGALGGVESKPRVPGRGGDLSFGAKPGLKAAIEDAKATPREALPIAVKTAGNLLAHANVAYENLMRRAVYHHAIRRELPDQANADLNAMYAAAAKGDTPAAQAAAKAAVGKVTDFLGDFTKYGDMGPAGHQISKDVLDVAVPFHRWIRFISEQTLKTLPAKYPGRLLLLDQLGQLGIQVNDQEGLLPQYLQGSIGIGGIRLGTQGLNQWSTIPSVLGVDRANGNLLDPRGLLNSVNPAVDATVGPFAGYEPTSGFPLRNQSGQNLRPGYSPENIRAAGWNLLNTVPVVGAALGRGGRSATGGKYDRPSRFLQPQQSPLERWLAYTTGVNVRPFDYDLNTGAQMNAYRRDRFGR